MTETELAAAVNGAVEKWMQANTPAAQHAALADPAITSATLGAEVEQALVAAGVQADEARQKVMTAPFFHLEGAFAPGNLPDTPQGFSPIPDAPGCNAGRAAALAVHGFLGLETVSYGTENGGALFVNLVALPGEGRLPEKSKDSMRGHTDGVSFPFKGDVDATHPRVAPSPDLVTLVGMRNPDCVATTVMALSDALGQMSNNDIGELKKEQYSIRSQATFTQAMKKILGEELVAFDAAVLKDVEQRTYVRYSHTRVVPPETGGAAAIASTNFAEACRAVAQPVTVKPGDVLVVSNRFGLHGRGVVGGKVGGQSRWLMRTYALDTKNLDATHRHLNGKPEHILFP